MVTKPTAASTPTSRSGAVCHALNSLAPPRGCTRTTKRSGWGTTWLGRARRAGHQQVLRLGVQKHRFLFRSNGPMHNQRRHRQAIWSGLPVVTVEGLGAGAGAPGRCARHRPVRAVRAVRLGGMQALAWSLLYSGPCAIAGDRLDASVGAKHRVNDVARQAIRPTPVTWRRLLRPMAGCRKRACG